MAEVVRELAAKLSLQTDRASFKAGDAAINSTKQNLQSIPDAAMAVRAALAGVVGYGLKKIFVDFNSDIEQSVISLAAIQKMFKGGDWGAQMETAGKLVEHYQEVAKASVGETRDFLEMHKGIAASAYQAGASLEDLKQITKGAVIASSAMGESAIVSAMDVKQALSKGVSVRDRFMMNLLASEKITQEKFNAMTKKQRVDTLKRLLTSDWIKDASKQMEFSFAGVVSTMKDTLSITFGKIGLPLFKALTSEITKWNKYLDKPDNAFFTLVGRGISELTSSFKIVAATVSTIVGLLEQVNKEINRIKGSDVGNIFATIANPIKEAYETLRDIADYMSGEASALGLSRAIAQGKGKEYIKHAEAGGKFTAPSLKDMTLGGEIIAKGREKEYANRPGAFDTATSGLATRTALEQASGAFGRGDTGTGIMAGLGAVTSFPLTIQQSLLRAGRWGYGALSGERPTTPDWSAAAQLPGTDLTSRMPGPWALSPPPPMASGLGSLEPPPTKLSGDVKISVKVNVPNMDAQVEKSLQSIWREGNELVSREP